ncbi:HNH endonuclease [Rubrobacter tropicus]|uniref:HNH endonuclease n=1 Tax=Rubrobacter tropicus TaxID=2653851 RepID=A0A6G8Q4C5_9ACTN|nr:YDG/SRA domain-containing protein [Rubrobacter tropicus]QIN81303.1 HNH endonuclease [Rubrobacter tropicus]
MAERIFGHIPGYPEGSLFESRAELRESGVHRPIQAGISGSQTEGAESIVLSGGYEDDADDGDLIIYTGYGGRNQSTGRQDHDQPFSHGNRALALSKQNGLPVRVIRGSKHDSRYSPPFGYSYDGLYAVEGFWHEPGRSGFEIWRFRLVKIPQKVTAGQGVREDPAEYSVARRQEMRVSRIVRDSAKARKIKALYKHRCQICGTRLSCPAGPYSEAAHIRPLGAPHDGPDTEDNILCLCPNHHVLFDNGAISVAKDLSLIGADKDDLTVHRHHHISLRHLAYHRKHLAVVPDFEREASV